jgi:hypothetical protein
MVTFASRPSPERKHVLSALAVAKSKSDLGLFDTLGIPGSGSGTKGHTRETAIEAAAKDIARAIGSEVGRRIIRGVLGSIPGGRR